MRWLFDLENVTSTLIFYGARILLPYRSEKLKDYFFAYISAIDGEVVAPCPLTKCWCGEADGPANP